jgi:hypothetical protein
MLGLATHSETAEMNGHGGRMVVSNRIQFIINEFYYILYHVGIQFSDGKSFNVN